jgi:DNA-binding MarR family transcriptional regulator
LVQEPEGRLSLGEGSELTEILRSDPMNAQKESFEFDLDTLFRLEKTKWPSAAIAVYAELLAFMAIYNSLLIDCEVRFLAKTLKIGTHTVIETLSEFRRMGLVKFIPSKKGGNKRFIELIDK